MDSHRRLLLTTLGLGASLAATGAAAAAGTVPPRGPADARLVPDSGRDETLRVQQAIDAATAARRPLTLPPGRFRVASLKLHPGARLYGAGPSTVIEHMGGAPAFLIEDASDVVVADLSVTGGAPITRGRALIEAMGAERLQLSGLTVTGSPANAIMLERSGGRIMACSISGAAKAAIWSLDATGLEISHNTIADCANNGILVWRSSAGSDGTVVTANRIERIRASDGGSGQNGNGINVFRAGGVIVSANRITECAYSAVRANSASNVQIIANSAERIGEVALYAEFAFEGAVISGNVVDGAATGISVTNFNDGGRLAVVQGNVVRNLVRREGHADVCGDGIAVEADASVTGNVVEGAPTTGIVIGFGPYCRDVVATGNVVRRCGVGIGVTAHANAGPVLIAQNMITSARDGAIRSLDHGRPVGPDLALHTAAGRITLAGNVVA